MTTPKEAARYLAEQAGISEIPNAVQLAPGDSLETHSVPLPPFPEEAWVGLFAQYRDLVANTTEAPDVYHFFCFAVTSGATLARRVFVYHAVPLYPNWFVALVGRTGITRKDTARARASRLLQELNADDSEDPKFIMLPGVGSAEGLIECLGGDDKVVVIQEAELLSLVAKARRDATANLMPHLTALYDCPELYTLKTRHNPVTCRRVFLSLVCGTTPAWLRRAITEHEAYGGFANRFVFAFGEPKEPIAFPPKVDAIAWERLRARLNEVRIWAGTGERELDVDSEAVTLFTDWYSTYHALASKDGLLPALGVRFQSFAWKLALLYAAQDQAPAVLDEHLQPALAVVDWLWASNRAAFAEFVQHGRELETAIIARLRDTQGEPISKRSLYKTLHVSAKELEQATEPLLRLGILQAADLGIATNGKTVEGLRVLDGI